MTRTVSLHRPAHDCAAPPSKVRCAHTGPASASGAQISAVWATARFGGAQQLTDTAEWRAAWAVDEIGLVRPLAAVSAAGARAAAAAAAPLCSLRNGPRQSASASAVWRERAGTTRGLAAGAAAAAFASDVAAAGAALERAVLAVAEQLSVKLPLA